ncbi:MAG: GNAT family N-acetyltransferase [Alphaproteobacteria bacterium]|nr:GNAT family N-acetyltransferase [Alphaproteobacteria bacterium]
MNADRDALRAGAASPRRANDADAGVLSRLFAASFLSDPVFDWIARRDPGRAQALERFFFWLLRIRVIPFGEVWMSEGAAAAWLPPGAFANSGGFFKQIKLLAPYMRLCGLSRLARGPALATAMEKNHPAEPYFYLAYIAVAPRLQGLGLGGKLLGATLNRADAAAMPAYLENSNPWNTGLYERCGFIARRNIAPPGGPPLIAMWRPAAARSYGSSSLSQ